MPTMSELDQRCVNAIRFLAVDAVERAKSGHPGAPMGAAAMAYTLWDRVMKFNPRNPAWPDRDRFILSAGHASMLLYALLHLTGYDLSLDDIKSFRQLGSKTPGHPESERTPGVEVTTGPLGQGFANGVGMAIAADWLACRYNTPEHPVVDHFIYALVSDGDLEEGVSAEAASLAGTLGLGRLIYLYDDNGISIEGDTDIAFREDVGARFRAYGWQVLGPIDGNDIAAVETAIRAAQRDTARPSLIICRTVIGYGSPEEGTGTVHGEPLGAAHAQAAKARLGWPLEPAFHVPADVLAHMRRHVEAGARAEADWNALMDAYAAAHPERAAEFHAAMRGDLPAGWDAGLDGLFPPGSKPLATRGASGTVINALAARVPILVGGSADLAPSTKTRMDGGGDFTPEDHGGRNLHFGVREHAMGAIANGMARHGGVIPYTATFLTFSDYMRPPIRLAALMGIRVVFVFTHDSIALGEDGPTHQPVEHLAALRAIPRLRVIRPADAAETAEAWLAALRHAHGPTALALTRQNLPVLDRTVYAPADGLRRGGYVLWESAAPPALLLIATGSEVHITLEAATRLADEGLAVRVVSLPCWELFDAQPADYRAAVLPPAVRARVAVEAGIALGWERYIGPDGAMIGVPHFGASAPGDAVMAHFGFTPERIIEVAKDVVRRVAR